MRKCFPGLALVLCLGLGTLIAIPTGAAEPVDAKKIEKLIEKLGGDDFNDREKASAELDAIGAPALEALRKAAKNKDVEVSKRSADIVARIEKRGETARLLAPKKVHLVYRDTPVAEAIADFAKKSGYPIQVVDPENKLKGRKISLDTGEVTFWQALDQLCTEAGLVEADLTQQGFGGLGAPGLRVLPGGPGGKIQPLVPVVPPAENKPAKEEKQPKKEEQQQGAEKPVAPRAVAVAQVAVKAAPGAPAVAPVAAPGIAIVPIGGPVGMGAFGVGFNGGIGANQIVLVDGKNKAMPSDNSGAIRVRAMEKVDQLGPVNEKEILLGLKLSAEPKLQILQVLNVRVDKALDDASQSLTQAANPPADPNAPAAFPGVAPGLIRGPFMMGGMGNQVATVRLKKGEKASKSLKELTGVISAQILTPATPAITAEKILEAAGKEFKGAEGGKLKILQVTRAANGQITVRFELEQPPNLVPANAIGGPLNGPWGVVPGGVPLPAPIPLPRGALPLPNKAPGAGAGFKVQPPAQVAQIQIQIQANPGGIVVGPGGIGGAGFFGIQGGNGITMEDDKGNVIQVVGTNQIFRRGAAGILVEHVMVFLPKKDQKPTKLVFSGSKSVAIEVPFALKNVTLP